MDGYRLLQAFFIVKEWLFHLVPSLCPLHRMHDRWLTATCLCLKSDIFALVQRYKNNYAKAQTEITGEFSSERPFYSIRAWFQVRAFNNQLPSFLTTDLQEKLRLTRRECSGLEERHKCTMLVWLQLTPLIHVLVSALKNLSILFVCFLSVVKTELEEKIAELNRTDTKGALSESCHGAAYVSYFFLYLKIS